MARRKSSSHIGTGCMDYVTVTFPLRVCFPADEVICDLCEFCHSENSGTRFRCYLTGEILPFHGSCLGQRCPLGLQGENNYDIEEE